MQQQISMAWGIVSICRLGAWHRRLLAKDSILLLFCAVNGVGACSSKLLMVQMYCRQLVTGAKEVADASCHDLHLFHTCHLMAPCQLLGAWCFDVCTRSSTLFLWH